jgi:hypothetical protein
VLGAAAARARAELAGVRVDEASAVWRPTRTGLVPAWRVGGARGARSYTELVLDARDGSVLAERERARFGQGVYPWFGSRVEFATTIARGNVYASVADALVERATSRPFKGWSLGVPEPVGLPRGFLVGAHVDVYDGQGEWAIQAKGRFDFSAVDFPQFFDQANAYWQVESFYRHLRKTLGRELATDYALPVIVNVHDALPGGYYTPAALADGHATGYVVLFDLEDFLGPGADSARDPTLVAHEYVHAWLARDARAFGGALGDPTRAIEEALADFFATAKAGETAVGRVLAPFTGASSLRDLDDGDHLAETLADAHAQAAVGLFDEHRASEVLGALFVDLRRELGVKRAERLIERAIDAMPHAPEELGLDGFASLPPLDAGAITFASAALALLHAADAQCEMAAIVGAATGRGVFGDAASACDVELELEALPKRTVTLPATFALGGETHVYSFRAAQGRKLSITIVAEDDSLVQPDFVLVGPLGAAGAKHVSAGGRRVRQSGIELAGPTGTVYRLEVQSSTSAPGRYRVRLDA